MNHPEPQILMTPGRIVVTSATGSRTFLSTHPDFARVKELVFHEDWTALLEEVRADPGSRALAAGGRSTDNPAEASLGCPFVNSIGLPFVPIPGFKTPLCAWIVRVKDFESYCAQTKTPYPDCDFSQAPDHPAVNVTWNEARSFCRWLTRAEWDAGRLAVGMAYRLPEDLEWSAAVGLPGEHKSTPGERSGRLPGYPWGPVFPPPKGAGNYHPLLGVDDFRETSPVGAFTPNILGIYDLGGNVWEWCLDEYEPGTGLKVLRGAACFNDDAEYLLSSYRDKCRSDRRRNNNGFRIALSASAASEDPWF